MCDIGAYEHDSTVPTAVELLQLVARKLPTRSPAVAGLLATWGALWATVIGRRRRQA